MKKPKQLRALTVEEMNELRTSFLRAADLAKAAGFDAVEIHGAHGYLLAGFLSPAANQRKDEYGGNPENRFRFIREVVEGVREQVGKNFPILFRLSGQEYYEGGREIRNPSSLPGGWKSWEWTHCIFLRGSPCGRNPMPG